VIYVLVASHSILGFVASIISSFQSDSDILLNNFSKCKSHIKTQFIGDIAQPSIWYIHLYHPDSSNVTISKYSSTIAIVDLSLVSEEHILQISLQISVSELHSLQK
jgi:hypothetical protein